MTEHQAHPTGHADIGGPTGGQAGIGGSTGGAGNGPAGVDGATAGIAAGDGVRSARPARTRWIVILVLAALVGLWVVPGGAVSWVRPALLALAAGVVAVWYWRRSGRHARRDLPAAPRAEDTRDVWDALDRGEDLTDDARV